jgi:hypothetical protein
MTFQQEQDIEKRIEACKKARTDYKITINAFGSHTRGTIHVNDEEFPRMFVYFRTRRYRRPTGVDEARGCDIPAGALRTNPPKLEGAVGRAKFIAIFNEISDVAYVHDRCGRPEEILGWQKGNDEEGYLTSECPNVILTENAIKQLEQEVEEREKEKASRFVVSTSDDVPF